MALSKNENEELMRQQRWEDLNDGYVASLNSAPSVKFEPRILCIIPALACELRKDTILSIANQTVAVSAIVLLTTKAPDGLAFPAKISWVINDYLAHIKLVDYDYLLRVDADTVLPKDFLEQNLKGGYSVQGYGSAQIIRVKDFIKFMGGRLFTYHDDGYPITKLHQCGCKTTSGYYATKPVLVRVAGLHHGASWFVSQGELHYQYGCDVLHEMLDAVFKAKSYHPYGVFILFGYFKALFLHRRLFDVAGPIRWRHMALYREPKRFLILGFYINKKIRGI